MDPGTWAGVKSKLYEVATATIVGSILANVLLVLGLAFVVGGTKNGRQFFEETSARRVSLMLLLSVAALVIPALTALLHTPAAGHERALSVAVSILLLILFALSVPASVEKTQADSEGAGHGAEPKNRPAMSPECIEPGGGLRGSPGEPSAV